MKTAKPKTHEVIDTKTGDVVGRYSSLRAAYNRVNRLDLQYGSSRYRVRWLPVQTAEQA